LKTRLLSCVVALAMLASCAKKPVVDIQTTENEMFLREKGQYEPSIGKDYWIKLLTFLCPTPKKASTDCVTIVAPTKLQVDGLEQGAYGTPYYHVRLSDGRSGYIMAADLKMYATDIDPAVTAADCKRRGDPRVGMTAKQVRATCWGEPDRVDRRETARGVTERYVYGRDRHVLLHNGVVTSVQISGTLR